MRYELYYWPGLQGRGEFVRLALEEAVADYVDIALVPEEEGGGVPAMTRLLAGDDVLRPPFAPPFLKCGKQLIGQTANILLFLGGRLKLAPRNAAGKLWTHQLQLTLADLITEVHDTHHPIDTGRFYEEQRTAAKQRSAAFLAQRLPKYLGYFARVLQRNATQPRPGPRPGGRRHHVCRSVNGASDRWFALRLSFGEPQSAGHVPKPVRTARRGLRPAAFESLSGIRAPCGVQQRRHLPALSRTRHLTCDRARCLTGTRPPAHRPLKTPADTAAPRGQLPACRACGR